MQKIALCQKQYLLRHTLSRQQCLDPFESAEGANFSFAAKSLPSSSKGANVGATM